MLECLNKSYLQGGQARARLELELLKTQLALNLLARKGDVCYFVGHMVTLFLFVL